MGWISVEDFKHYYVLNCGGKDFKETLTKMKNSFEAREWKSEEKRWIAPKTPRNDFLFRLYNGENVYADYDLPIDPEGARELAVQNKVPKRLIEAVDKNRPFQWIMLSHALRHKNCLVAADMRLGKTVIFLMLMQILGESDAWFVSTVSAINSVKDDITKWGFTQLRPTAMTYDAFTKEAEKVVQYNHYPLPRIICYDEMQSLKSPNTARGNIAVKLNKFWNRSDRYCIGLSGTPSQKRIYEIYNLTEVLCPGFLMERNQQTLKETLCYMEDKENPYGKDYKDVDYSKGLNGFKEDELKRLSQRLQGLVMFFRNEDFRIDYSPPERVIRTINISKQVKSAIRLITASTKRAELRQTLMQISDGFKYQYRYNEDGTRERINSEVVDDAKIKVLEADLAAHESCGRIVIYARFSESVNLITDLCIENGWAVLQITGKGEKAINTTKDVDYLNKCFDPFYKDSVEIEKAAVVAQADCGCTGREFSMSPSVIFYSNTDKSSNKIQAQARIDSMQSPHPFKQWIEYQYIDTDSILLRAFDLECQIQEVVETESREKLIFELRQINSDDYLMESLKKYLED